MIVFESPAQLKKHLYEDQIKPALNPIRFVNGTPSSCLQIKKILEEVATSQLCLAEYCSGADTFPNLRRLRHDLRKTACNILISGLSEFFRLTPTRAPKEINYFLTIYPSGAYPFRIYFLMTNAKKFFIAECATHISNCFLSVDTGTQDKYSLTIIQSPLKLRKEKEHATGVKDYLRLSPYTKTERLILYTGNALSLRGGLLEDTEVITDSFELLVKHYDLPRRLQKRLGSESQWQELAAKVARAGSFEKTFLQTFNVAEYSTEVFNNYGALDRFKQWLLWLKVQDQPEDYASLCARSAQNSSQFVRQVYELIFAFAHDSRFEKLYEQRKKILLIMKCSPPASYLSKIRTVSPATALKILTDTSHAERLLIFETLQKFPPSTYDLAERILQKTFPTLSQYLSDSAQTPHTAYFKRYRWLKVTDAVSAEFVSLVTELASNKGKTLYALEARNQIITEEYSADSAIFFIDGLGAEYLNYFTPNNRHDKISMTARIGRCNLPSVTEVNKDFLDGRRVTYQDRELDRRKHETRPYPENILSELEYLKQLKEKIRLELSFHKKIIVSSDHGSSRLAVLVRQSRFDKTFSSDGRRVYKHGRFADTFAGGTSKISTALESDDKIIFADYSRFVQKGSPGNELHGGASLEEVLVPIITFETQ